MSKRTKQEQDTHDKAVSLIAKERFSFPTNDHPNLKTYVNEPQPKLGVKIGDETLYPDIVVLNTSTDEVPMIGEVESDSTVTQAERDEQWKKYSKVSGFYLYLPKGLCQQARDLAKGLAITRFRYYAWNSDGSFSITNC
jgi:hypothetical protein